MASKMSGDVGLDTDGSQSGQAERGTVIIPNKTGDVKLVTEGSQSGKAKRGKVILTALAKRKGKGKIQ